MHTCMHPAGAAEQGEWAEKMLSSLSGLKMSGDFATGMEIGPVLPGLHVNGECLP